MGWTTTATTRSTSSLSVTDLSRQSARALRGLTASAWFIANGLGCTAPSEQTNDTGASSAAAWDDSKTIRENCFPDVGEQAESFALYDRFSPTIGRHCAGTAHQEIAAVEKVVFLGDSITAGTWPTPEEAYYRHQLTDRLQARFGPLEVSDCSEYGARTDDLLEHSNRQITECFNDLLSGEATEDKRTLVIWTMGGNDLLALGEDARNGAERSELLAALDGIVEYQREALDFFKTQEATLFPAGVDVVFTNNYEYTDGTGDFASCPTAEALGLDFDISSWALGYLTINEAYMKMAVETQTDMVLMLEHFCGHGFHADDPEGGCYKGPDTPLYFDPTCIHPSEAGHTRLAELFETVIVGE